jgi:hypothetical protein
MTEEEERVALVTYRRIAAAVEAVINDTPTGAPAGVMYGAICTMIAVSDFQRMLALLVETGRVYRKGNTYYPAKPTRRQR